jgi:hypothetical protein
VEFVSSKGMVGDSTGIHFNTMGQLLFGQRYADMLATGRLRREMLGRWALDEMAIAWNGTAYGPVSELTGQFMPGVLWGYGAESESLYVNSSVINQPGPTGDPDRAYNFTEPSGISGVNTGTSTVVPEYDDFTILAKIRTDKANAWGHVFSNRNTWTDGAAWLYVINTDTERKLGFSVVGGVTLSEIDSPIFDGQWHTIGVTRKGDSFYLLREGAIVAAGSSAQKIQQSEWWMIGRARFYNGDFDGEIGDIRIYNYSILDRADLNNDGAVNLADFPAFGCKWLELECHACDGADLTHDGQVNLDDLNDFVSEWLI